MNFPDSPLVTFLYDLINTPGYGGIAVGILAGGTLLVAVATIWWILRADAPINFAQVGETTYAYPTVALHHEEHE